MKKVLALALLAFAGLYPSKAAAVRLDTTAITEGQFKQIAEAAPLAVTSSSFVDGTVTSAVFEGMGELNGLTIFTAKITVKSGVGSAISYGDVSPFLTSHLFTGVTGLVNKTIRSFYISSDITDAAGPLGAAYGSNGTIAPAWSELDSTSGAYRNFFTPSFNSFVGKIPGFNMSAYIGPGGTSRVFGFLSGPASTMLYDANIDGGIQQTSGKVLGPAPAVPEPGTLLLLGSGLSGLAAWGGWRRRKPH